MKFGYQGNYWADDREMHVNNQSLGYVGDVAPGRAVLSQSRSQQYINPYNVNARAMQTSLFAQDQWTLDRLTLAGRAALRPSMELVP